MSHVPSRHENPWSVHMAETRSQSQAREEEERANQVNQPNPFRLLQVSYSKYHAPHHSPPHDHTQASPCLSFSQTLERFHVLEVTPQQEGQDCVIPHRDSLSRIEEHLYLEIPLTCF